MDNNFWNFFGKDLSKEQKEIIDKLVHKALTAGVVTYHDVNGNSKRAKEGSAAEIVVLTTADIRFAIKIDKSKNLVKEAMKLRSIADRPELPKGFSKHFPKVYAIKSDKPPYAYIMQAFDRESYAEYLFKGKNRKEDIKKIMIAILKVLMPAYSSTVNYNLIPSIKGLYLDRINERIDAARIWDENFFHISTNPITINGVKYETPETYLSKIRENQNLYSVNFTTFVHGDCNLENILIKSDATGKFNIKFIDTKDWHEADYMFDIGKIVHYLTTTGPAQIDENQKGAEIDIMNCTINYSLNLEMFHIQDLLAIITKQLKQFASKTDDLNWEKRLLLSISSNLMGLPMRRLRSNDLKKINAAYILYAEGLIYLAKCCE